METRRACQEMPPLERLKFVAHAALSDKLLDCGDSPPGVVMQLTVGEMFDDMRYSLGLVARVTGRRLPEVRYPADWWQAFKERWFPVWAKERWPVRFTTCDIQALYPDIQLPASCGRSILRVESAGEVWTHSEEPKE